VVGRFYDERAPQLDIFRPDRDPVTNDQYLMAAALVLPDIIGEDFVDLREHFFAHRSWFFGAQLASVVFSLFKTLALQGHLPGRLDTKFQFTFCAVAIVAFVTRSEWFHKLLAPAFGLLFAVYIALLFARL
jgi:hypothetical protein